PESTLSPSISTSPLVGSTMRLIMRSSVVLPHPDDPTNTVVLREGSTRLKSSTASVPSGNLLITERNSIMSRPSPRLWPDLHLARVERDVGGDVLAHALERGWIRVRVPPHRVRVGLTVDDGRVVLGLALPRTGVRRRAL